MMKNSIRMMMMWLNGYDDDNGGGAADDDNDDDLGHHHHQWNEWGWLFLTFFKVWYTNVGLKHKTMLVSYVNTAMIIIAIFFVRL